MSDETVTNDNVDRIVVDGERWWMAIMITININGDRRRLRWTTILTNNDGDNFDRWQRRWMTIVTMLTLTATVRDDNDDDIAERFAFMSSTTMVCKREKPKKFLLLCVFFKILFFVFSTNLRTCSFDHLCKELPEMEIEKWSLKKWRKPNVYWSKIPSENLLEELEQ
jgi:hypothetical protein